MADEKNWAERVEGEKPRGLTDICVALLEGYLVVENPKWEVEHHMRAGGEVYEVLKLEEGKITEENPDRAERKAVLIGITLNQAISMVRGTESEFKLGKDYGFVMWPTEEELMKMEKKPTTFQVCFSEDGIDFGENKKAVAHNKQAVKEAGIKMFKNAQREMMEDGQYWQFSTGTPTHMQDVICSTERFANQKDAAFFLNHKFSQTYRTFCWFHKELEDIGPGFDIVKLSGEDPNPWVITMSKAFMDKLRELEGADQGRGMGSSGVN